MPMNLNAIVNGQPGQNGQFQNYPQLNNQQPMTNNMGAGVGNMGGNMGNNMAGN